MQAKLMNVFQTKNHFNNENLIDEQVHIFK